MKIINPFKMASSRHFCNVWVLTLLGLWIALVNAQGCSDTTCAGSVTLVSVSPAQCYQPTSCDYRCSTSYVVGQTGISLFILPLVPLSSGCQCAMGYGVLLGRVASMNFTDGTTAAAASNGTALLITTSLGCQAVYQVSSGNVLDLRGPPGSAAGVLSLATLTPPQCVVPTSCYYSCALGYVISQVDSIALVSSLLSPASGCQCALGTAKVTGSRALITFTDGSEASAATAGKSVAITADVQNLTCYGTYDVIAGSVLGQLATNVWAYGRIALVSLTPSECNVPTSCYYLCATGYAIMQAGSSGQVVSTYSQPSCSCSFGSANITQSQTASIGFADGSTASASVSGRNILISASVQSLTCNGVYKVVEGYVLGVQV